MSTPSLPLSEYEAIKACLPQMLLIRITNQYGDHAVIESKKLEEYGVVNKVKSNILLALRQRNQWRSLCDKIDRELRYSQDSKELPQSWLLQTPYMEMINKICEETGWDSHILIEEMKAYAYTEKACFVSHIPDCLKLYWPGQTFVNPFADQHSVKPHSPTSPRAHAGEEPFGPEIEQFWQSPHAEAEALLRPKTDSCRCNQALEPITNDSNCNHTRRRGVSEVTSACDWVGLHAAIERDMFLVEMIFPTPSQEANLLSDILMRVRKTYFREEHGEQLHRMNRSRRASIFSVRSSRKQKIEEKLASKGKMNIVKRRLMRMVLGASVCCRF
ncbi:hypothetical protein MMC10_005754 [Thelotrema lepadinum]|nr:hypothetical protein [Thelotrema lepadinum]